MSHEINFISVNIAGHRFIDLLIPFLKNESPDVIALQEIYEVDAKKIADELNMEYSFVTLRMRELNDKTEGDFIPWGLATLSKFPIIKTENYFYEGDADSPPPIFIGVKLLNNKRSLFYTSIDSKGTTFNIAHTHAHGWSEQNSDQESWEKFEKIFKQVEKWGDLILCGDFNSRRGQKAFDTLAKIMKDNIPTDIKTTIDSKLHNSKGDLNIVIDGLFTSRHYEASNVRLISGVSDHIAIAAKIKKHE